MPRPRPACTGRGRACGPRPPAGSPSRRSKPWIVLPSRATWRPQSRRRRNGRDGTSPRARRSRRPRGSSSTGPSGDRDRAHSPRGRTRCRHLRRRASPDLLRGHADRPRGRGGRRIASGSRRSSRPRTRTRRSPARRGSGAPREGRPWSGRDRQMRPPHVHRPTRLRARGPSAPPAERASCSRHATSTGTTSSTWRSGVSPNVAVADEAVADCGPSARRRARATPAS